MPNQSPNLQGHNQYAAVPKAVAALQQYHRENITNNKTIAARLLKEHNITMSDTTVKRRRKELSLYGSQVTTRSIPQAESEQLVLSQMGKDPRRRQGLSTIKAKIAFEQGVHLTRDFVSQVMHQHDSEGFTLRDPSSKKIFRVKKMRSPHSSNSLFIGR